MADLTYDEVSRLIKADFDTGKLYWLPRTPDMFSTSGRGSEHSCKAWNARYAGKEAVSYVDLNGYRVGPVLCRRWRAHRVIWLLAYGSWPSKQLDHINGDRQDNRICNLREVSNADNARNASISTANTTGVTGVYWHKASGKWMVRITSRGQYKYLGLFEEFDDAVDRRKAAEAENNFHPNHGKKPPRAVAKSQADKVFTIKKEQAA